MKWASRLLAALVGALRRLASVQPAIAIATLALIISGSQFYAANFYKWSSLRAMVTRLDLSADDQVEIENGNLRFTLQSQLALSLINYGNAPSAVLRVFLVAPIADQGTCSAVIDPGWRMMTAESFFNEQVHAYAYDIESVTVGPGAIVVARGTLRLEQLVRRKSMVGKTKDSCLMFYALDHNGEVSVTTVDAVAFDPKHNAYRFRDAIQQPISLTPHSRRRP